MNRILPLVVLLALGAGAADRPAAQTPKRPVAVEDLITVRKPSEVQISPDGKWVAFTHTTPDLERNSHLHDLYVVPTDGSAPPRKVTNNEPRDGFLASRDGLSPVWGPASDRLVYVARRGEQTQIYALDVRTGQESLLVTAKELGEKTTLAPSYRGRSIAFAPDGTHLAFLATETEAAVKPADANPSVSSS
jgi:Tol biopolymer transport system component